MPKSKNESDYFIGAESAFFKMENFFFTDPKFEELPIESISLWCYFQNLENYAIEINQFDSHGIPYVLFPIASVSKFLRCGAKKSVRVLQTLESFNLIRRENNGSNPDRIFILSGQNDHTNQNLSGQNDHTNQNLSGQNDHTNQNLSGQNDHTNPNLSGHFDHTNEPIHLIQENLKQDCEESVKSSSSEPTTTTTSPPVISKNYSPQSDWGYVVYIIADIIAEMPPRDYPTGCLDGEGTLSPLVDLIIHKYRYTSSQVRQPRPYLRTMIIDVINNWATEFAHHHATSIPSPRKPQAGPMMPKQLSPAEQAEQSAMFEAESRANMERLRKIMRGDFLEKPE